MKRISEKLRKKLEALPDAPGCYLMRDAGGRIIYIGKAASLRKRVRSYFRDYTRRSAHPKIRSLVRSIADFDIIQTASEAEAILTEGKLIKEFKPYYNTLWKDDKRFLLIRIDVQHPWPRVSRCRLRKEDGARYFGPYVSARAVRAAVDFVTRRFGLRRCRVLQPDEETYRHCLDDVIADCSAPCIGRISPEAYRRRVEEACAFLDGERMDLLEEVRGQMEQAAAERRFEEAAALRDLWLHLQKVVKERARVRRTPALRREDALEGVRQLRAALGLAAEPRRIECFDISHISGTHAVAGMVCAVDGLPAPKYYRRFRIKTASGGDDPASMAEVVRRRYSRLLREGKPLPDLVLVDGGITQLRAARAALDALGLEALPAAGLAKRYERLVREAPRAEEREVVLAESSAALRMITRLRDEAHRFAIEYHRSLRSRRIRESRLDEIPGIGPAKKALLLRRFGSVARLARATEEEIAAVPGIGPKTAALIHAELTAEQTKRPPRKTEA